MLYRIEAEFDRSRALKRLGHLMERLPERKSEWMRERALLLFRLRRYQELIALMGELQKEESRRRSDGTISPKDLEWAATCFWWSS